jgi:hypothetical protein
MTDLEPLVLKHSLDGSILTRWRELSLENHPKRPIANDLALRVLHFPCLPCQPILDLLTNYFCEESVSISPSN